MTKDEVFQEIARIISGYTVFQSVECAEAIKAWLKVNDVRGVHLQISALGRIKFIVSDRWRAGGESIAQTGVHPGIETYGMVFDNLSPTGLTRSDWLQDFDCASGEFKIEQLELF